jgi:hypothetical protein
LTPPQLTYTQSSVAFPTLPPRDREIDHVNVQGPESSIEFVWIRLGDEGRYPHGALQLTAFSDAFRTLLHPGITSIIFDLSKEDDDARRDISPDALIERLEAVGAEPSHYHLRGLDRPGLSLGERNQLHERIARAREWE